MDGWTLFIAGVSAGAALLGVTGGFIYLILRLMVGPLQKTLDAVQVELHGIRQDMKVIEHRVKTEEDLATMISLAIHEHQKDCQKHSSRSTEK